MKTFWLFITLCLLTIGAVSVALAQEVKPLVAVAAPTIKPQWICTLTNTPSFNGTVATVWEAQDRITDTLGNAAVLLRLAGDPNYSVLGDEIVWISAKGIVLETIEVGISSQGRQTQLLHVSATALYTTDVEGDIDANGNPYAIVKYTIKGKAIVRTPFFTGSVDEYMLPQGDQYQSLGFVGISATNFLGNPTSLSFYKY